MITRKYLLLVLASFGLSQLAGCLDFHAKELDVEVTPVPGRDKGDVDSEKSENGGSEDPIVVDQKV